MTKVSVKAIAAVTALVIMASITSASPQLTAVSAHANEGMWYPNVPGLAIDGNPDTKWLSNYPTSGPDWIYVDLGQNRLVDEVTVTLPLQHGEFINNFNIETAADGSVDLETDAPWTAQAVVTGNTEPSVNRAFAPVQARYVRLSGINYAYGQSAVSEIEVFGEPASITGALLTAVGAHANEGTSYPNVPGLVIDGNPDTKWLSAYPTSGPDWIYVDLGQNRLVNGIIVTIPLQHGEFLNNFGIETAPDGSVDLNTDAPWTTQAGVVGNAGPSVTRVLSTTLARYLRISGMNYAYGQSALSEIEIFGSIAPLRGSQVTACAAVANEGTSYPNVPGLAIDGNPDTKWLSAYPTSGPDWIYVDLCETILVSGVVVTIPLQHGEFLNNFTIGTAPEGTSVAALATDAPWTTRATVVGNAGPEVIRALLPTPARYLRIAGMNYAYGQSALSEIEVLGCMPSVQGSDQLATVDAVANEEGTPASNVTDGNTGTKWLSSYPTSGPDWLYVDLGADLSLNAVRVAIPVQHGEYLANFSIDTAPDGTSVGDLATDAPWTAQAAVAGNTGPEITRIFASVTARYVRIAGMNYAYGQSALSEVEVFNARSFEADGDGDGFTVCGDGDCNDDDNTIFPGAPELCDGIDNNCDGASLSGEDINGAIDDLCTAIGAGSPPTSFAQFEDLARQVGLASGLRSDCVAAFIALALMIP